MTIPRGADKANENDAIACVFGIIGNVSDRGVTAKIADGTEGEFFGEGLKRHHKKRAFLKNEGDYVLRYV